MADDVGVPAVATDAPIEIVCVRCRLAFTWTVKEQRFYASRNLFRPKRCKECLTRLEQERAARGPRHERL